MIQFGVLDQWKVFDEELSNCVPRSTIVGLNDIQTARTVWLLILDVVARQPANLDGMSTHHLGEVILPDEQVFVVLPRGLVPERRITTRCPAHGRQSRAFRSRENGRELRSDLVIERLPTGVGLDENVVSGLRELELIDHRWTERVAQLDRKAVAGLIPIGAESGERSIAPEVSGCVAVGPILIDVSDHQVHLAGDIHVASKQILASVHWFES